MKNGRASHSKSKAHIFKQSVGDCDDAKNGLTDDCISIMECVCKNIKGKKNLTYTFISPWPSRILISLFCINCEAARACYVELNMLQLSFIKVQMMGVL
jgi:hypothetical protein